MPVLPTGLKHVLPSLQSPSQRHNSRMGDVEIILPYGKRYVLHRAVLSMNSKFFFRATLGCHLFVSSVMFSGKLPLATLVACGSPRCTPLNGG
ncbi:hypothetical protein L211DRAFT_153478 [Terfezia boudieri ATCC MYA-4762]|uniref:BTB domain-containing protein n=1 Tax=Terfezia boudieri ATCC MYA-4762 TaxID=1051890 RepID=A0A3N4LW22_9PEZI|nr:hypothetical protein L211DRAFT_153478 [Terfezia boudieri ATCC MYA-4762]